ncbi:MAG: carboxylesterase family protein [Anaerolineaceae bacterium]|nr:carboxylesterase family protein [Anaerolineaceae bacterium]
MAQEATEAAEELEPVSVMTALGEIIGQQTDGLATFLGIPYAQAPVGDLRFRAPEPYPAWDTPFVADEFGDICVQTTGAFAGLGGDIVGSEDCLFLNIYTPPNMAGDENLPVMVWIHGGAFVSGSSDQYDLSVLAAENNIIAVSINYRLGLLGFMVHPALSVNQQTGASGNYGLMDQQLALQWVQDHISDFGGDPENVTIFGESAGGASVCLQVVSPSAAGLFVRAISQSGLCLHQQSFLTLEQVDQKGEDYTTTIGCDTTSDTAECLRNASLETLLLSSGLEDFTPWWPVIDGHIIPQNLSEAFASNNFNQVPLISGSNQNEGRLFDILFPLLAFSPITEEDLVQRIESLYPDQSAEILERYSSEVHGSAPMAAAAQTTDSYFACPALALNDIVRETIPIYAYEFSDTNVPLGFAGAAGGFLNNLELGAFHAAEITYVLRTPNLSDPSLFTPEQDELSKIMMQYWVNFAYTGNPNGDGLPEWQPYAEDDTILEFIPGAIAPEQNFSEEHNCDFWNSLGQ